MVYDPMHEYGALGGVTHDLPGLERRWRRTPPGAGLRTVYQPDGDVPHAEAVDRLSRLALEIGDLDLVLDELSLYCNASQLPDELGNVVARGRHRDVNLVAAAQRAAQSPTLLRSQAGRAVIFRQNRSADVAAIASELPEKSCAAELIPELEHPGGYLDCDIFAGTVVRRRPNPVC